MTEEIKHTGSEGQNDVVPMIPYHEYMTRMGKAITAYTAVFGGILQGTLDAKVQTGQLTKEQADSVHKSTGQSLLAYLAQVEEKMKAKLTLDNIEHGGDKPAQ